MSELSDYQTNIWFCFKHDREVKLKTTLESESCSLNHLFPKKAVTKHASSPKTPWNVFGSKL